MSRWTSPLRGLDFTLTISHLKIMLHFLAFCLQDGQLNSAQQLAPTVQKLGGGSALKGDPRLVGNEFLPASSQELPTASNPTASRVTSIILSYIGFFSFPPHSPQAFSPAPSR
jgi:hypothetical protein